MAYNCYWQTEFVASLNPQTKTGFKEFTHAKSNLVDVQLSKTIYMILIFSGVISKIEQVLFLKTNSLQFKKIIEKQLLLLNSNKTIENDENLSGSVERFQ